MFTYRAVLLLYMAMVFPAVLQQSIYDPQGVFLDGQGVLDRKETDHLKTLAETRKKAKEKKQDQKLCYISLPRLFDEAKKCVEKNQPISDNIKYLNGMVELEYIFVFPDDNDIVIAGRAEPFDGAGGYRPFGTISGRPVLQLDDLVCAMRVYAGKKVERVGCDIRVTKENAERAGKKCDEVMDKAASGQMNKKDAADAVAAAAGEQPVEYYGIAPDTRFAFACVEADFLLKQLGLGLVKGAPAKIRGYSSLLTQPERPHRFFLESDYECLLVSADGNSFQICGKAIKVSGGLLEFDGPSEGEISNAAKTFVESCNKNLDELVGQLLPWADLTNLSNMLVLSALMKKESLCEKVKWDTSWILKDYKVVGVKTPRSARSLCNYNIANRVLLFTSGGVRIDPNSCLGKRKVDDAAKAKSKRPLGFQQTEVIK